MRNSPTKPFSPGTPIEASIDDREHAGEHRRRPCSPRSPGSSKVPRRVAIIADEQEQRRGEDAVVEHLQHRARDASPVSANAPRTMKPMWASDE